jgi:ABC-type nitrate/sulfonate/bicarbonate transport system substrate-binding protein
MRTNGSIGLLITAIIAGFFAAPAPTALAAEAKPPIKVVAGYGSADGAVAPLWFAKEKKLFEKRGLDVVLVGMGTGSVSLRALIAKDLEIASLSGSGLVQAALQGGRHSHYFRRYQRFYLQGFRDARDYQSVAT